MLREELGLDPGRALQELERSILLQEAALDEDGGRVAVVVGEEAKICPFKGLEFFDRGDSEYFCGRERIVRELLARLGESSVVGILGPSGIGKSSLLRAGVLAALSAGALPASAGWRQLVMRPGEHPCLGLSRALGGEELASVLAALAPGVRLVVAVDQLEELFTTCEREDERAAFLEQLCDAACDRQRRAIVLVALRGDFYVRFASHPRFAALLSGGHVLIGPMERHELARAIQEPAARAGLEVERGSSTRSSPTLQRRAAGCPCSRRCLLSCGGDATAGRCALRAIEPAVACTPPSRAWPRRPTNDSKITRGGSRAWCWCDSPTSRMVPSSGAARR